MLGNGGGGWPEHWVGFHQGEEGREDRLQEREDVEGAQAHMGAGWSRKNMWGDVSRFGGISTSAVQDYALRRVG